MTFLMTVIVGVGVLHVVHDVLGPALFDRLAVVAVSAWLLYEFWSVLLPLAALVYGCILARRTWRHLDARWSRWRGHDLERWVEPSA